MARNPTRSSAVSRLVKRLREQSLATAPGEMIGSEDQLVATYKVSRPTLRQAAALVSQEQLLTVRRGTGGGYFARRPEVAAVAHVAAIYLQSRHTTLREIITAVEPIRVEMATLAAQNRTPDELDALKAFLVRDNRDLEVGEREAFLRSEREFARLIATASHNSVLYLFITTLHEFSSLPRQNERVFESAERVRAYWSVRQKSLVAIIEGDAEIAGISARRAARMITEWLMADGARTELKYGADDARMPA